ncbi:MAG: slipin family protein [Streptosporangiales bacterium]|nr:slipin family protein [Streptosporangiales bacterium]
MEALVIAAVLLIAVLFALGSAIRIVQQYERGVVFRLGRVSGGLRNPGLALIVPVIDRLRKVNMQIITLDVPAQQGITRDNVTVKVDAVVYYRVIEPVKAIVNVQDYRFAVSQISQTSLRSAIGKSDLDQLLSEREKVNAWLKEIIDEPTEGPWGIRVERVEVKDVSLPEAMKRSMSRQAEAERDRRARIISADGEYQASKRLAAAAHVMSADPASLQLRLLQTVVQVASEKNSTLVMPLPVEVLRFFDAATRKSPDGAAEDAAESADSERAADPDELLEPPETGELPSAEEVLGIETEAKTEPETETEPAPVSADEPGPADDRRA